MASSEAWLDFDQVRHNIKNNTVDKLKQILSGLNDECGTHFSKSGKKQEIIDRIVAVLDMWRAANHEDKYMKAKSVVYQVRNTGTYTPSSSSRLPPISAVLPTPGTHASYNLDPARTSSYSSLAASTSSIAQYDPYAPPRRPSGMSALVPSSSSSGSKAPAIRFKESPFFTIDQSVSAVIECPESTSATDRRQQSLNFTLNSDQILKLKGSGTKYQLRLFCTSSVFYAGVGSFRTNPVPCPIEFPPTCEVRVNNTQLTANMKGLKKKPGTAPPPEITKFVRTTGVANRIEMVYVNSQQPIQPKKYHMVVMLVESITIDALVKKLRQQNFQSGHSIQQQMIQAMSDDDDIIAGPQKMSLRCPLTFVRITTPCRSSKCVHPQCFDATSWFTMMEQTTTWLCPVCERTLDHRDLIIDGYFDEILKQTPESVEDVIVEADGQWHTSDNKYGSKSSPAHSPSRATPNPKGSSDVNGKGKAPNVEIFVLDSDDDEDEGRVKRELSPSYASSTNQSFEGTLPPASQSQSQVIDLTLDSEDDDEEPPIIHNSNGKRKASEAELGTSPPSSASDHLWKKGRIDPSRILPLPRGPSGTVNGVGLPHLSSSASNRPPTSPSRYPSSFQGNTLPPPPVYPAYPRSPSNGSLQLRPMSSSYVPRPNDSPRWS
ncbi:PINIT domain-containing protein [Crassisporium funariophilum]|nr:PINIT domain-containing protein [Crassisporium funariophilum]